MYTYKLLTLQPHVRTLAFGVVSTRTVRTQYAVRALVLVGFGVGCYAQFFLCFYTLLILQNACLCLRV